MKKLIFVLVVIFAVSLVLTKEPNIGKSYQAPPFESRDDVFLQEGFESGALPTGWSQEYVNGSIDWDYENGGYSSNPGAAHTGNYNALFYEGSYNGYSTKLITPPLNLAGVNNLELSFWMAMVSWAGDLDELDIYFKPSAGGTWTHLYSFTTEYLDWTEMTITLPNPTSTYYIAFEGLSNYGYGVCIDDVLITGDSPGSNLIDEDFGGGSIPAGWSVIGDGVDNWEVAATNYAGGTAPELEFGWSPSFEGTSYFTSPVLATAGYNSLNFEFDHSLDDYSGSGYSIGILTTSDGGSTWYFVDEMYPTGDIPVEHLSYTVNTPDVGSNNFQIAFYFNGNSFNLDYWYIDNVLLSTSSNAGNIVSLSNDLKGNYPNPFNPTTAIAFSVVTPGHVSIDVYNIKGEKVKTLVDGIYAADEHTVVWNGTDNTGKKTASGVYFYKMISNNYTSTRKMILMK